MTSFEQKIYVDAMPTNQPYFIGADIGGTNSNFGIFSKEDHKLTLVCSLHTKSQQITDFTSVIKDLLDYLYEKQSIHVRDACFAVAGVVPEEQKYIKPTNVSFVIDIAKIRQETSLKHIEMINDFAVIGYGAHYIDQKNILTIKKGIPQLYGNRAYIGAGTGLGKAIFFYAPEIKSYYFIPSEGGHADAVAQTKDDIELFDFMRKQEEISAVSWEHVVSGSGIKRLYHFYQNKEHLPINSTITPEEIFAHKEQHPISARTYQAFSIWYARAIKNFALQACAHAGIYIAGGIAAKNSDMFYQNYFRDALCHAKQQKILKDLPIYLIIDYNVSLYGAAAYLMEVLHQ